MTGVYDSEHHSINDSETLLRRVIDIIATARTIPLSSSPMINRDEILEMLEEALNRLPDELRQARWMLKERDEFLTKTRRESDDILDAARAQAELMVQRTEVVRAAELRARQIVQAAECVLSPFQPVHEGQRAADPAFASNLQRVAQLLRRDAHLVQRVRVVQLTGVRDRRREAPSRGPRNSRGRARRTTPPPSGAPSASAPSPRPPAGWRRRRRCRW